MFRVQVNPAIIRLVSNSQRACDRSAPSAFAFHLPGRPKEIKDRMLGNNNNNNGRANESEL